MNKHGFLLQIPMPDANVRAMTSTLDINAYCAAEVRENDLERYYVTLFAPAAARPGLWAVLAFNQEISKIRDIVSEPMLGEIRLQWWREAFEGIALGTPRAHPVVEALATIPDFAKIRPFLEEIIDCWSAEFEGGAAADLKALEAHANGTGGALAAAILSLLAPNSGATELAAARGAGKRWALVGALRALPYELRRGAVASDAEALEGLHGTVAKLEARLGVEFEEMRRVKKSAALKLICSLDAMGQLYMKALQRSGKDFDRFQASQPGNVRKLIALFAYNMFGK